LVADVPEHDSADAVSTLTHVGIGLQHQALAQQRAVAHSLALLGLIGVHAVTGVTADHERLADRLFEQFLILEFHACDDAFESGALDMAVSALSGL